MRAADREIDAAMYNSGGLRTSIPRGDITFGRMFEVMPFESNLIKVSLTGRQIRQIVEHGLASERVRENLRVRLGELNQRTAKLRDEISTGCGERGRIWYEQLKERTERRRSIEGQVRKDLTNPETEERG
jgi:hypothetical protein